MADPDGGACPASGTHDVRGEYDADPLRLYSQALTRIWPVKQPVAHWRPIRYVDPDAFGKVVNWAGERLASVVLRRRSLRPWRRTGDARYGAGLCWQ